MLSTKTGEDTRKPEQLIGSPLAIVTNEGKLEEEKEETKDEEQAAIQTLFELPKTCTPTQTLQKPSTDTISLQLQTLGSSSTKVERILNYGDIKLDEDIIILSYEFNTITIEKITKMQNALDRR